MRWLHTLWQRWCGEPAAAETPASASRLVCYGCQGEQIVMVLPASPEALTYRCAACGRQWSMRAVRVQRG